MPRDVFTTGEIAEICRVAPRTVFKWLDLGFIDGYRLPGSRVWRVTRESLVRFLEENDIPVRLLIEYEIEKERQQSQKITIKKSKTNSK